MNQQAEPGKTAENKIFLVKVVHSSETQYCSSRDKPEPAIGEFVVIETRYGKDLGRILGPIKFVPDGKRNHENDSEGDRFESAGYDIYAIHRKAADSDLKKFEENRKKEAEAFSVCREKIRRHDLDMKLVSAHYILEEPKILFFFTADARVDFRELVKDLVSVFKIRVELRQIGVRDESRVVGGLGVCGRYFCCHGITDKLRPVSIKMAKVQNLSLNSMKISGPCGRLLCCLSYEFETYADERKRLPSEGNKLTYDNTLFKIVEINILSRMAKMSGEDGRQLEIPFSRLSYNSARQQWEIASLEAPSAAD